MESTFELRESTYSTIGDTKSVPSKVDFEKGIIYDCMILKPFSKHGYVYTNEVREKLAQDLNNKPLGLEHPPLMPNRKSRPHKPEEIVGKVYSTYNTPDGIKGNLKLLKSHPFSKTLLESASEMPDMFGLSILIDTNEKPIIDPNNPNGPKLVKSYTKARYIDIVTDPATTHSLFESESIQLAEEGELEHPHENEAPEEEHPHEKHAATLHHAILNHMDDYHPHLDGHGDHEKVIHHISEEIKKHHKLHHSDKSKKDEESKKEETKAESESFNSTPKYPVKQIQTAGPITTTTPLNRKEAVKNYLKELANYLSK